MRRPVPPVAAVAWERFFGSEHERWPGEWCEPPRPWGSIAARRLGQFDIPRLLARCVHELGVARGAARVEAHLATCSDCGAYLDQIRTTIAVVERLRVRDVPEPVLDELVRAFRGWSAG